LNLSEVGCVSKESSQVIPLHRYEATGGLSNAY
jgi:hypothetical protein